MRAAALLPLLAACGAAISGTPSRIDTVAYPDGTKRFEFTLRGGLPNGPGRAYHRNGKLAHTGSYQNGARHGLFRFYGEDGAFVSQAIYFDNSEVWSSTSERQEPPEEWKSGLAAAAVTPPEDTSLEGVVSRAPRAYFSTVDRTTPEARAGMEVGVSDAEGLDFGAATRVDVFGHYRFAQYGVFAQLSETRLAAPKDMTLSGRRTFELDGTYHRPLGHAGTASARAGLLIPIANNDTAGFLASSTGATQRPTDAAAALPSSLALRTGASWTRSRGLFVLQADLGLDWVLGGAGHPFDVVGRANAAVGIGTRSTALTLELDNALRFANSDRTLHSLAIGGTITGKRLWTSASLAFSYAGTTAFIASVGRDL